MDKIKIGKNTLFPSPVTLIGTKSLEGKINAAAFAWTSIINSEPPMIGVAVRKSRLTHEIIMETNVFSVNIPSSKIVKETDYCGIVSGREADKINECKFNIFYGDLEYAPLIKECPLNMECMVKQIVKLPSHDFFIAEIIEVHIDRQLYESNEIQYENIDTFVYLRKCYKKTEKNLGIPYKIGSNLRG